MLLREIEASGLAGRGGASFPVATKWRDVSAHGRRRPVVVANGAEGEPASAKDGVLLSRAPHLVLDGVSAAVATLGAGRAVVYVPASLGPIVRAALAERRSWGVDTVEPEVIYAPEAFIAGQESAVVNAVNGGVAAIPSFTGVRSIRERGVGGRPTLVHNVETLAHVALIARFGATWYRGLGTASVPGTMLITVSGLWEGPAVVEAAMGTPFTDVLGLSMADVGRYQGALLGGYGGGWVRMDDLHSLNLSEPAARRAGASLGAGVVALLPRSVCPLVEVARVVRYMAEQGAGQCGPCVNGLPALAEELRRVALGAPGRRQGVEHLLDLCTLVDGRGACRHPDGVARFVRTACAVFPGEVAAHLRGGPCSRVGAAPFLPVPPTGLHRAQGASR